MPRARKGKQEKAAEAEAVEQKAARKEALKPEEVKFVEDLVFSADTYVNMAIYAILEAPQELYFGSHSEKNVNILEKVTVCMDIKNDSGSRLECINKPYYSPTKQRGIERRAIAYSLVKIAKDDGELLVPYYRYFNLSIDVTSTYPGGKPDPRDILTFVWGATWTEPTVYMRGRVGYGGGVAIQPGPVLTKQRNRVEYRIFEQIAKEEEAETAQMIWSKEYAEPHILIPVYRTGILLGVENYEPHAVAYAFLKGLELAGAGTPKGLTILEAYWLSGSAKDKVIVVDVGTSLLPEPVVVSPAILSPLEALAEFGRKVEEYKSIVVQSYTKPDDVFGSVKKKGYVRLVGNTAYTFLRDLATAFASEYLMNIEKLQIPRVQRGQKASQPR